jgi:hypothetical protein
MSLRADAPVFIPSAAANDTGSTLAKGDQLIQDLAAAMTSSLPPTGAIQKVSAGEGISMPRTHIDNDRASPLRSLMTSSLPAMPFCMLPAAGIFCPYCIAGNDCAFHKSAVPAGGKQALLSGTCNHLGGTSGPRPHAQLAAARRFAADTDPLVPDSLKALVKTERVVNNCVEYRDVSSDLRDAEETSTDVGGSEGCAASDASDSFPTFPENVRSIVRTGSPARSRGPNSHNNVDYMDNDVRAHHSQWGTCGIRVARRSQCNSRTLAR